MAKGNKKRGNQCRRRAAIRQKMAETGQSYTSCLLRGEAARDGEQVETRPAKLSDVFEGRRFPLPAGTRDAVAKWQMQNVAATMGMARYIGDALAQQQAFRRAMVNPLAEAIKTMVDQQEAFRRAATFNPLAEVIQQYTAQQQMWRLAMANPLADAIKQLNPLGEVMKHFAVRQQGVRLAMAALPR